MSHNDRAPRLLWVCPYCLLDTSSGASISIRELLLQLASRGWDIHCEGCTIFDAEAGLFRLSEYATQFQENLGQFIHIADSGLTHHILSVASTKRQKLLTEEEDRFFAYYLSLLDSFKPDLIFSYGGHVLDMCVADEAADRGIPVLSYLVNGNYQGTRWCRDIDLILTDSNATAQLYKSRNIRNIRVIGTNFNPARIVASEHLRKNVLFINPSYAKGVQIVIVCALMLENTRPDITFEIVESRGSWKTVLEEVTRAFGHERSELTNVIVTEHASDMRPIYGRARLTMIPSLWFESFGRVSAESMLNGIPAIVSTSGGLPENIGDAGITVAFPKECHEAPYTKAVMPDLLKPVTDFIERCYDDDSFYQDLVQKAFTRGKSFGLTQTTARFIEAVRPFLAKRAGDSDYSVRRTRHKQL